MDPNAARRFVEGQRQAAKRTSHEQRDPWRDAAALMDVLAALGDIHPAILELRERDERLERERWIELRHKLKR